MEGDIIIKDARMLFVIELLYTTVTFISTGLAIVFLLTLIPGYIAMLNSDTDILTGCIIWYGLYMTLILFLDRIEKVCLKYLKPKTE